jgi:hypothetical protein
LFHLLTDVGDAAGGAVRSGAVEMEAVSMPVTATRVPSATRGTGRRVATGRIQQTAATPAAAALTARSSVVMGGRVGRPVHRHVATSAAARDQVRITPSLNEREELPRGSWWHSQSTAGPCLGTPQRVSAPPLAPEGGGQENTALLPLNVSKHRDGRRQVVTVRADYILKGKGQIKLAAGESLTVGRDSDDSDFVVASPNGAPTSHPSPDALAHQ